MKLLVDAHVFDGKYQGTRTYLQGIYSYMTKNKDIEFYFASKNIVNIQRIFGEAENIHYIQLKSSNKIFRLAFEFPKIIINDGTILLGIDALQRFQAYIFCHSL